MLAVLACVIAVVATPTAWAKDRGLSAVSDRAGAPGGDVLVAADAGINQVFALDATVVYPLAPRGYVGTNERWLRLVKGRRLEVRGMPRHAVVTSIGRDRAGRVVLVVGRAVVARGRVVGQRWWTYDVARDTARRMRVPVRAGCRADALAVWRSRMAYFEHCAKGDRSETTIVVRDAVRTRRVARQGPIQFGEFALRRRSLGARIVTESDDSHVLRLQDRGRWCVQTLMSGTDYGWRVAQGVWIGASGLEWAFANGGPDEGTVFRDLAIMTVGLSGACEKRPVQGYLPAPATPMQAFAIDRRSLYYATPSGLYRHRLPKTASMAPPANDDFEHATPLTEILPIHLVGKVGHATRQAGEPDLAQSPDPRSRQRSVWYAFRPSQTGWVELSFACDTCDASLFTGQRLADLEPLPTKLVSPNSVLRSFPVEAGTTYWIAVASAGDPTYEPFMLDITASAPPPANDDLEHATLLDGPLPLRIVGTVGYATSSDPNEPQVGQRTVWYAFRSAQSRWIELTFRCGPCRAYVFTGSPPADLVPALPQLGDAPVPQGTAVTFRAIAGRTYWIDVASDSPTDEPFTIDITSRARNMRLDGLVA